MHSKDPSIKTDPSIPQVPSSNIPQGNVSSSNIPQGNVSSSNIPQAQGNVASSNSPPFENKSMAQDMNHFFPKDKSSISNSFREAIDQNDKDKLIRLAHTKPEEFIYEGMRFNQLYLMH